MSRLGTIESLIATLNGLLNNADDITALNGGKYLTTRLSNNIVELRRQGLLIENERIRVSKRKFYDKYKLTNLPSNREKAKRLLHYYENIDKVINAIDTAKN